MARQPFWEWVISPNHNEIVVDLPTDTPADRPAPPSDLADTLIDWVVSPNHNEILVPDEA